MKKLIALLFAVALSMPLAGGFGVEAYQCPGINKVVRPIPGFQQLTVSTVAVGLTVPRASRMAVIVVELADIRFRDDLTSPTATVGTLVQNGESILICGSSMPRVEFIRDAAVNALLNVSYYGF